MIATLSVDSPNLAAALAYAELGYPVLPCVANQKRPATFNGFKDATTDPEQIEKWWRMWPMANVAIRTDGLLVLDIDGADNQWLASEPDKALELSVAPMQITP